MHIIEAATGEPTPKCENVHKCLNCEFDGHDHYGDTQYDCGTLHVGLTEEKCAT